MVVFVAYLRRGTMRHSLAASGGYVIIKDFRLRQCSSDIPPYSEGRILHSKFYSTEPKIEILHRL